MKQLKQNKRSIVRMVVLGMFAAAVMTAWNMSGELLIGGGSNGHYVWAQSVAQPSVNAARAQLFPQGVKNGCFGAAAMVGGVATVNATCAAQYQYCGVEGQGLATPTTLAGAGTYNCGVTATATATAVASVTSTATTAYILGGSTTTATTTLTPTVTSTATSAAYMQALAAGAATGTVVIFAWPF